MFICCFLRSPVVPSERMRRSWDHQVHHWELSSRDPEHLQTTLGLFITKGMNVTLRV